MGFRFADDAAGIGCMEFLGQRLHFLAQVSVDGHRCPSLWSSVEKICRLNDTAKHLFKADGLGGQLHQVALVLFGLAVLVLDDVRLPASFPTTERNAVFLLVKLDDVENTGKPKACRGYCHGSGDQQILADFREEGVVGLGVEKVPLHRQSVVGPGLADVDQPPLTLTEIVVLQTGDHQVIVGRVDWITHRAWVLSFPMVLRKFHSHQWIWGQRHPWP